MKEINELRTIEVLNENDEWVKLQSIGQVEKGDVFRMFEPTGEAVKDSNNNAQWTCIGIKQHELDVEVI